MGKMTLGSLRSRAGHLHLTPEHLEEGVPGDAQQCAIAVALEELLPAGVEVMAVNQEHITVGQQSARWHARTPAAAAEFIMDFDDCDEPEERAAMKEHAAAGEFAWDLAWAEGDVPAFSAATGFGEGAGQ